MAKDFENFNVSYDEFHENIGGSLLALQKGSTFVDVSLACLDGHVQAHKVILAASSQFFQTILNEVSSKDLVIYLKGVKVKYLTYLIDFIYNGNVDVPPSDLQKFLDLGQELKVKGLVEKNKKGGVNAVKNETIKSVEFSPVVKEIETESEIAQDPFDPLQDDTIYYEDYSIGFESYLEPGNELGDIAAVREKLLDPSSDLTFSQEKLDQNRFLSHLLSIMQKTSLKGPKGYQWSCLVCGKVYPQRNHLQEHVESKHVKGVRHSCSLCSQEFTQSKHLKFHVKTFHESIYNVAKEDIEKPNSEPVKVIKQEEPPCKMARFQEYRC